MMMGTTIINRISMVVSDLPVAIVVELYNIIMTVSLTLGQILFKEVLILECNFRMCNFRVIFVQLSYNANTCTVCQVQSRDALSLF